MPPASQSAQSAMADLLGDGLVAKNALYRCLDKLLPHKAALFSHLRTRRQDLFAQNSTCCCTSSPACISSRRRPTI